MDSIETTYVLDKDEKRNQQVLFDELNAEGRREDLDVWIDQGMSSLIERVNLDSGILTRECCSGLLRDHYDLETLRQDITYNELKSECHGNLYQTPRCRPFLSCEPFMHSFKDNGKVSIEDAEEFYVNFVGGDLNIDVDGFEKYISWDVSVEPRIPSYNFVLPIKERYKVLHGVEDYDEYDSVLVDLIEGLSDAIISHS